MGDGTGCDNMTAVIVRFQPSLAENKNNKTGDDAVVVAKKRPVSPSKPIEGEDAITSEKPLDECKRAKIETV